MEEKFGIMCFSWNASGLRLCETMSQSAADKARKGFKAFVTLKQPCVAPDFFDNLRNDISTKQPALVVMSTEDEDKSDTYFHAELLPNVMKDINYSLLKREQQYGIGEVAAGFTYQNVPSGKPSGSALRMSIYARNDFIKSFKSSISTTTCRNKATGAVICTVTHPIYGSFAFIATSFPNNADLLKSDNINYITYRSAMVPANNLCLISILSKINADHIIILGDLGYDIVVPGKSYNEVIRELTADISANGLRKFREYDELTQQIKSGGLSYNFKEGIGGEGPLFVPTYRLARNRTEKCVPDDKTTKLETSCFENPSGQFGGIGWHDRILYKENLTSNYILNCVSYNRMDILNMHKSTHAGVIGYFEMNPVT